MAAHTHVPADLAFWPLALMWFGMMAAMMMPTAWPWVRAFRRVRLVGGGTDVAADAQFASGYLIAWFGYGIGAALLQRSLQAAGVLRPTGDLVGSAIGALIFFIAGLYQFAPLKRACLTHCRTPIGYFLTRWIDGPAGAFRMGLHHGIFCVGCCWALMATSFVVGVMSVWWMIALALVALAEQVAPFGDRLRMLLGGALLAAAIIRLDLFR